jgi:acetyl-CoA synthetase
LACAEMGIVHSVVFSAFDAGALKERIDAAKPKLVITQDSFMRGTKKVELAKNAVEALKGSTVPMVCLDQAMLAKYSKEITAPPQDANSDLFYMFTSGSTGTSKCMIHAKAGYLLGAAQTAQDVLGLGSQVPYWCTADVGWITGHTYNVYGPLMKGANVLYADPANDLPNFWNIIADNKIQTLYTAPTLVRMLNQKGILPKSSLKDLKQIGLVGERSTPHDWDLVRSWCPSAIQLNTWWQTETGHHMLATQISDARAGIAHNPCAPRPILGANAQVYIVDDECRLVRPAKSNEQGNLAICQPWPGMARTIKDNPERFSKSYLATTQDGHVVYVTGDAAKIDETGQVEIVSRSDDQFNIAGHLVSLAELDHKALAILSAQAASVACVAVDDEIKGQAPVAFIVVKDGQIVDTAAFLVEFNSKSENRMAPLSAAYIVPAFPTTESAKILRRLMAKAAMGVLSFESDASGGLSFFEQTLEGLKPVNTASLSNPQVLENIIKALKASKPA